MSISDIMNSFRGIASPAVSTITGTGTPTPVATQAVNNTTIPSATTAVKTDGNQPAALPTVPAITDPASPLSNYADVINKQDTTPVPSIAPSLNMDPAKLAEAAQKMSFSAGIDTATLQKAVGPTGDATALQQIVDAVGRNAFLQGVGASGEMVKQSLSRAGDTLQNQILPDTLRRNEIESGQRTNPIFQNPAARPIVETVTRQFMQQYPNATASEINAMTGDYLNKFSREVVGGSGFDVIPRQKQTSSDTDWSNWGQ